LEFGHAQAVACIGYGRHAWCHGYGFARAL